MLHYDGKSDQVPTGTIYKKRWRGTHSFGGKAAVSWQKSNEPGWRSIPEPMETSLLLSGRELFSYHQDTIRNIFVDSHVFYITRHVNITFFHSHRLLIVTADRSVFVWGIREQSFLFAWRNWGHLSGPKKELEKSLDKEPIDLHVCSADNSLSGLLHPDCPGFKAPPYGLVHAVFLPLDVLGVVVGVGEVGVGQ